MKTLVAVAVAGSLAVTAAPAHANEWSTQSVAVGSRGTTIEHVAIAPDGSAAAVAGSKVDVDVGPKLHTVFTKSPSGRLAKQFQFNGVGDVAVAAGPRGSAIAIFTHNGALTAKVRQSAGRSWRTSQVGVARYDYGLPQLARDPNGNWLLVAASTDLRDPKNPDDDVRSTSVFDISSDGTVGESPEIVAGVPASHSLAMDASGRAVLATTTPDPAAADLVGDFGTGTTTSVFLRKQGGKFTSASSTPLPITDPAVAAGPNGHAAVVGTGSADCSDYPCTGRTMLYFLDAVGGVSRAGTMSNSVKTSNSHVWPSVAFNGKRALVSWTARPRVGNAELLDGRPYVIADGRAVRARDFDRTAEKSFPYDDGSPQSLSGGRVLALWLHRGGSGGFAARLVGADGTTAKTAAPTFSEPSHDIVLRTSGRWAIAGLNGTVHGRFAAAVSIRRF